MNTLPKGLVTAGYLAAHFQLPVNRVLKGLSAVGAEPAVFINGLAHYDAEFIFNMKLFLLGEIGAPEAQAPVEEANRR